jgi:hypothetical protein
MAKKLNELHLYQVILLKDNIPEITICTTDREKAEHEFFKQITEADVHIEDDDHRLCLLEDGYCETYMNGGSVSFVNTWIEVDDKLNVVSSE